MPSSAYQRLFVIKKKNGNKKGTIIAVKKTGYYNFWINGTHYYYDERDVQENLKDVNMRNYFPHNKKIGVIVVQRK